MSHETTDLEAKHAHYREFTHSNQPYGTNTKGSHLFCEPPPSLFPVRGENYLEDRVKVVCDEPACALMGSDFFESDTRIDHIAARADGFVARARAAGFKGKMIVINLQVPLGILSECWLSHVAYFAVKDEVLERDPAFAALLRRMMDGSDEFRTERIKLVPRIVEGPWLVKTTVPQKPALLGNKLTQRYFHRANYFEIDCDVGSSVIARKITGVAASSSTSLVVDLAWTIEGRAADELPERLLGAIRVIRCNLSGNPRLEE